MIRNFDKRGFAQKLTKFRQNRRRNVLYNIANILKTKVVYSFGMSVLVKYLCVLGIAALPVLELRGAIPYGVANGLPYFGVLAVSVIGNMLPVPFIILFVRKVFAWMKKKSKFLAGIAEKLEKRAENKMDVIEKYEMLGLFILVAIPLPGTGAWTGSLISALLGLRLKNAFPMILLGVLTAGVIMMIISYGVGALIGA